MIALFATSSRSRAAFVCRVISSEPWSCGAQWRNLKLFLLRHLKRLHQLIDVFRFVQFPNNFDNLFRSVLPTDRLDKREKFSFDCRIFEPILCIAQRSEERRVGKECSTWWL